MLLHKLSDKVVFNTLSGIKVGYLEITSYQGETFRLGNPKDNLKAKLIIKKPNFSFNLIRGGSIGFAESYMRGEFETDNLSDLIEITARNIKIIYKFFSSDVLGYSSNMRDPSGFLSNLIKE